MAKDTLRERVTKLCLALPETACEVMGDHAGYRVKKKVFAYYLNNHHGDGIIAIACKVLPGDNAALIAAHPRKFYMPAYIGPRGWVGLRLDLPKVDWSEVRELIAGSYQLVASPKPAARVRE
ncbi:MAG TPA: MmcQ/YjbR family DNA-binding protein [Candidatus Sulfopaludibacter sp.]|nr:MmcQ/YjbR family DNA-binding protein [Candidatus Sulfopaludibacter sp.]